MKTYIATNLVKGKPFPIIRTLRRRIKQHWVQVDDRNHELCLALFAPTLANQENSGRPSIIHVHKKDQPDYIIGIGGQKSLSPEALQFYDMICAENFRVFLTKLNY